MSNSSSRFLEACGLLALAGCLGATVTAPATGASTAFTGSLVASGLLGLIFAGRNVQLLERDGQVSLPPAVLTTIHGGWYMVAPLVYDVGFLATLGTQLSGTLVATFGAYAVVAGLSGHSG